MRTPHLLAIIALLVVAPSSAGHAIPTGSAPAADATLSTSPDALVVRWNEPVRSGEGLVLVGAGGVVLAGPVAAAGDRVRLPLPPLAAGRYAWLAAGTSVDGHVVRVAGAFAVAVSTPRARPRTVRLGRRAVVLSGDRVGLRTLRLWRGVRGVRVEWSAPGLPAPLVWREAGGTARGLLPFPGPYRLTLRIPHGFREEVVHTTIEIAP